MKIGHWALVLSVVEVWNIGHGADKEIQDLLIYQKIR
jgi:hypothetical protein